MKLYVGVSKACDSCGGDMRVIVRRRPLSDEDRQAVTRDTGWCAVTQRFEVDTDDAEPVTVNMNPGRGY